MQALALPSPWPATITICFAPELVGVPSFLQFMILIVDKEWRGRDSNALTAPVSHSQFTVQGCL